MGDPVIGGITTADMKLDTQMGGACREFWVRIPGLKAGSACTTTDVPYLYLLNPFAMDLVVLTALTVITTASGNAVELDIGLGNDAAGGSNAKEIFDTLSDTGAGVFEGTVAQLITGGAKCIWRKSGTSTDSYLIVQQGANADGSALRFNLFLKVIPYDDLIGREGEQAAITVV